MIRRLLRPLVLLCVFAAPSAAVADDGHPIAIRWWGQALTSIETYWNLKIAIDPYALRIGYGDPELQADLVLVTHEHFDHNNASLIDGNPKVIRGLDEQGNARNISVVLDRAPNAPTPSVSPAASATKPTDHAVRIKSIGAFHDDVSGEERGRTAMFLIEVDGVRILHCGDFGQPSLTEQQLEAIDGVDVLLIPVGGIYTIDGQQAAEIAARLNPHFVIPIHYKTDPLTIDLKSVDAFLEALPDRFRVLRAEGNTLAVSAADPLASYQPSAMVLRHEPWQMPNEMARLFEDKEAAARAAQAVFQPLSAEQMNHRPSDGTHTPRWNAEHLMGRELLFFSSMYHAIDPSVPKLDLNPQQMPEDYEPTHRDWSGAEEARQIERVMEFTRRFAYLLADRGLDEQIEGGPWTLEELLKQMTGHYREHTENVKKKFELPDWPSS